MPLFRTRFRRWCVGAGLVVVAVPLVWFGALPHFRSLQAESTRNSATNLATSLGLRLTDAESIDYAEFHGGFPDSTAYLVVDSESANRASQLRSESNLTSCRPPRAIDLDARPTGHRPQPSPTLQYCEAPFDGHGHLSVLWDPAADEGRRIHVRALEA